MARIVVGEGSCGLAAGAGAVYTALENKLGANAAASLSITGCIGICYLEPIVDVYDDEGKLYRCVQVKAEHAENEKEDDATMTLDSASTMDNAVENKSGATLPETGGIGTTLFYLLGGLMTAGSALVLVVRRRAEAEEE